MDPILDGLNPAQRAAVSSPASVLQVLAPPGSGKTKTLTSRVAYLLSHHGYRPQDVICCTFTIKASREMRERLAKLIGDHLESKLILGTFHSICRRYLVSYGYLIGLKKGFGIADSNDSLAIIRRIVKRLKLNIQPNTARARISHQKAHGVSPGELAARNTKVWEQQEFVQVYREYESALAASNLLDYDDLLLRCAELLRHHPQCVSNVQAVLVDEFQDTNHIQYELMNLFASKNKRITVVGDPDQSIYGFRSAEIKNLARMQKMYKDTTVALLKENYRSSGHILSSAQDVIEQDVSRPAKKLEPTHCVGTMPVLRKLPTAAAEARWMVLEIKRSIAMTGKLLNYSDFAVLLRSASLSRQIEAEMGKEGIPYKMVGGSRFFDRVEIKLLLDYLRVVSHTGNSDAVLRIINVPSRRIGEETIKLLLGEADAANVTLWSFIKDVARGHRSTKKSLSKLADQGLSAFVGLIETCGQKLRECNDGSAPRILLDLVIKKLSFKEYLKQTYPLDEDGRWANVEELLCQAEDTVSPADDKEADESLPDIQGLEQQQAHPGEEALARFLANVALATEVTAHEEDGQAQEKVTISTIHAAKGLEWPVVFVPAVYQGIIPHSRAEDSDEERRLLYVAMTRAQALLYLSYPLKQSQNGEETTATEFLPAKITKSRFRPTGPDFHNEKVVYGIADILGRDRPSAEDMVKDLDKILSSRDDRWTPEGDDRDDVVTRWHGSLHATAISEESSAEPFAKRRRYDRAQDLTSTTYVSASGCTMNGTSNFSMPTAMPSGFSTAREYIAANPSPSAFDSDAKPKARSAPSRKTSGLSQGSIESFLGQGSFTSKSAHQSSSANKRQPQETRGGETGQINRSWASNHTSKGVIPPQLVSHRLQPRPLQLSRPILEASDPNSYTWLSASSKPAAKPILCGNTRQTGENSGESEAGAAREGGDIKSSSNQLHGVRPVNTYHETSVSKLQQFGTTTGKRTLGIRRSMYSWEDRMNR